MPRAGGTQQRPQVVLARQLIYLVQGAAYLPQEIRLAEMAEALDDLMDVHLAMDNPYNEPQVAQRLTELQGREH
jgi:hypothetical protein